MWWKAISQNFVQQRKEPMILFRNNLLQGSFLEILCFNCFIDITKRCLKHLKIPFLNCSKEQRSMRHNDFISTTGLRACCGSNVVLGAWTGSGGSSEPPCTVTGASWQCVVQYWDPKGTVLDANCTVRSCTRNQGIPQTIGQCPNVVTNIGNCSLWSWIIIPSGAMCVICPDSIDLPLITSTCLRFLSSWSGIWWWRAKSSSINTMPVAPQSISAFVGISWLFTVNVQVITTCCPSIDPSNTSTLLTERREIPEHFKAFKTKLLPSTEEQSFFNWPVLFPIPWNLSRS